jgi:cell division protein FtsI (penicillin-binding protein 3)
MVSAIVLVFAILAGRSIHLYLSQGAFLRQEGAKRAIRTLPLAAYRGIIRDRHGVPLAVSTPVVSIWCDPRKLPRDLESLSAVSEHLGVPVPQLQARLTENSGRAFLFLRRHMAPERAQALLDESITGIYGQTEYKRFYPIADVTAQMVGITDIDHKGQEGVELALNQALSGEPGAYRVIQDRHHRMIEHLGLVEAPRPGEDIRLSLDVRFQYKAWQALQRAVTDHKAKAGTVVALDVATGHVLAMVSSPSFNPNERKVLATAAMRNRAVTDVFEPGSTIKPFTVLAALDSGLYAPDTLLDTSPGYISVTGKVIKDFRNYGLLDVTGVITKSSNVGVIKMVMDLEPQSLSQWLTRLGFGLATGVRLPGERDGYLPISQSPKKLDLATLSFGYGMSVTALQLARAYATVAAGGVSRTPTVLYRPQSSIGERVMGEGLALELTNMLRSVTVEGGTAEQAAIAGYHVAGKTGTVHKVTDQGYAEDKYLSLFAGFAPATAPRVAMVVVIDEPSAGEHFGGAVAAPVFAEAVGHMLRLEGVPPDAITPSILVGDSAGNLDPQ